MLRCIKKNEWRSWQNSAAKFDNRIELTFFIKNVYCLLESVKPVTCQDNFSGVELIKENKWRHSKYFVIKSDYSKIKNTYHFLNDLPRGQNLLAQSLSGYLANRNSYTFKS